MLPNEKLTKGAIVEVFTAERHGEYGPGAFVGTVADVTENAATIQPASPEVRAFLGGDGTYLLGSAHWPARVTIRG
jgi:hypothetical protein